VQLANYIVSYSLEINSRCLRYLADCDVRGDRVPNAPALDQLSAETHTVYAESLLARESRRLVSMRSLAGLIDDWPAPEGINSTATDYDTHTADLAATAEALSDAASPRRLALRLAAIAGDDVDAQAIMQVARRLPLEASPSWDRLNSVFAQDSRYWRNAVAFRELTDARLVHRIAKNYRRAYQRGTRLLDSLQETGSSMTGLKSAKLQRWQLTAHQLELLRPRLSEKGKAQAWYLDKLADTLRMRQGLQALQQNIAEGDLELDKATRKLGRRYVEQQLRKMDQRLLRLAQSCFTMRPKKMRRRLAEAASALVIAPAILRPPGWHNDEFQPTSIDKPLDASAETVPPEPGQLGDWQIAEQPAAEGQTKEGQTKDGQTKDGQTIEVQRKEGQTKSGQLEEAQTEVLLPEAPQTTASKQAMGETTDAAQAVGDAYAGESTIERAMRLHARANRQDTKNLAQAKEQGSEAGTDGNDVSEGTEQRP